jgi:hypothetical protein
MLFVPRCLGLLGQERQEKRLEYKPLLIFTTLWIVDWARAYTPGNADH